MKIHPVYFLNASYWYCMRGGGGGGVLIKTSTQSSSYFSLFYLQANNQIHLHPINNWLIDFSSSPIICYTQMYITIQKIYGCFLTLKGQKIKFPFTYLYLIPNTRDFLFLFVFCKLQIKMLCRLNVHIALFHTVKVWICQALKMPKCRSIWLLHNKLVFWSHRIALCE